MATTRKTERKTEDEINSEIAAIDALLPKLPKHAKVKIGIARGVLEKRMTNSDVYDTWGDEDTDEFDQEELDEALAAHMWMHGGGFCAPSVGWADQAQF